MEYKKLDELDKQRKLVVSNWVSIGCAYLSGMEKLETPLPFTVNVVVKFIENFLEMDLPKREENFLSKSLENLRRLKAENNSQKLHIQNNKNLLTYNEMLGQEKIESFYAFSIKEIWEETIERITQAIEIMEKKENEF